MLSFRVMRLVRPQPHLDAGLKLDLLQDTGPDADTRCLQRFSELSRGVVPKHLAQRAHAETYADLQAPGDVMSLPANFGYVYIGEVRGPPTAAQRYAQGAAGGCATPAFEWTAPVRA